MTTTATACIKRAARVIAGRCGDDPEGGEHHQAPTWRPLADVPLRRATFLRSLGWLAAAAVVACTPAQYREWERAKQKLVEQESPRVLIHMRDGQATVYINGELFTEERITQVWGKCRCDAATKPTLDHFPGPRHRKTCPRYRRQPFGSTK
jgi:hypothetical protein